MAYHFRNDNELANFLYENEDSLEQNQYRMLGYDEILDYLRDTAAQSSLSDVDDFIETMLELENDKHDEGINDQDLLQDMHDNALFDDGLGFSKVKLYKALWSNNVKVASFLKQYQKELHVWRRKSALALWVKETNLTKHNTDIYKQISLKYEDWIVKQRNTAGKLSQQGLNYDQKRMMKFILESTALKEKNLRKELLDLEAKIGTIYSKAKVCNKGSGKCYHFEPGLIHIFRTSRNYDELLWAWKGWRDAIGPKTKSDWVKAEKLRNKGAKEHGYADVGDFIRKLYEDPYFEDQIDQLWKALEPYYKQLHAFVRYRLHRVYGDKVSLTKPIPAHLLGNLWAMKWDGILDIAEPYPKIGGFAVTKGMLAKNITVHKMFVLADEFYRSIGLPKMTPQFWKYSMFTRPKDNRSVVCYASAHNLEGDDVRVKMCASVTSDYLYTVHHEMGHCQYYLAYNRHQPELYQSGANHGFHEAIGDTAALAVISPKHLQKLGILKQSQAGTSGKQDLNFLMQKALGKLAFFPFALTMTKWSWDVARGKIPYTELNSAWWHYREKYQGITPPVERTEKDFDPACKYHISYFVPYVRYFVSHILQFQFFESLCKLANQKGPLHRCDFADSKVAGEKFAKMLRMGQSKPWPEALKVLTNTDKMNANAVIRYFKPLLNWLENENKRLGNKIGW